MENFKRMTDDETRHEIELIRHAEDRLNGNDPHSLRCIRVVFVSLMARIYEELSLRQDEKIKQGLPGLNGPDFKSPIMVDDIKSPDDWPEADY